MTEMKKLTQKIVLNSSAFNNDFFSNCEDPSKIPDFEGTAKFAANWYFVTRHFGLELPTHLAKIRDEVISAQGEELKCLEKLMMQAGGIYADEYGLTHPELYEQHLGDHSLNERIHYNLWLKLAKRIHEASSVEYGGLEEISLDDAFEREIIIPETIELVKYFEGGFNDFVKGFGVYQAVETAAYKIMISLEKLTNKLEVEFEGSDLAYINIHKPIEGEHGIASSNMIDLVSSYIEMIGPRTDLTLMGKCHVLPKGHSFQSTERRMNDELVSAVKEGSDKFGDFWVATNQLIY